MGTGSATLGKVLQIGQESIAWGTAAVAQTIKLPGVTGGSLGFDPKFVHPGDWGHVGPGPLVANTYLAGKGSFTGEAVPKFIDYWLNGLFTAPTPTGAGPYVWTWAAPYLTASVPTPQTIAHGNLAVQGYRLLGALVSKLTISWTAGDTWKFAVDLMGTQLDAATPTASLADNAPGLLSGCVFTSDVVGGTMGATAIAGSLYGFQLDIESRLHMKQFGTLIPEGWGHNAWKTTLRLDAEYNSTTQTNLISGIINAGTLGQRQHSLTATSGATVLAIQHAGTQTGLPDVWTDRDGNRVLSATYEGTYNSGAFANYLKVVSTWGANTIT